MRATPVAEVCAEAAKASRALARADAGVRDAALRTISMGLRERVGEVLEANAADLSAAREAGTSPVLLDRLTLTPERVESIAGDVLRIAALPDPVGEVIEGR